MSSDSSHDAVLCAERRGRTPARSIDAALLARLYSRNGDYLMIKYNLSSIALMPVARAHSAFFFRLSLAFLLPAFLRSSAIVINKAIKLTAAADAIR
jgi:hypothetical protein